MFCFSFIASRQLAFSTSGGAIQYLSKMKSFCHTQLLLEYGHYKVLRKVLIQVIHVVKLKMQILDSQKLNSISLVFRVKRFKNVVSLFKIFIENYLFLLFLEFLKLSLCCNFSLTQTPSLTVKANQESIRLPFFTIQAINVLTNNNAILACQLSADGRGPDSLA